MGQEEVMNALEEYNKVMVKVNSLLKDINIPLCTKQIAEFLKEHETKVLHALKPLIKYNEVAFFEIDGVTAKKLFGKDVVQRRTRLYFIPKEEVK